MIYSALMKFLERRRAREQALIDAYELLRRAAQEVDVWQSYALGMTRRCHELALGFRLQHETPELDLRDDLDELLQSLGDEIARLEEQIVQ